MGLGTVIDKEIQGHLVVTVRAPEDDKFDFFKLHDYCFERGFTIYPGKMFGLQTFRLCNLGLITEKDIQDFFRFLGKNEILFCEQEIASNWGSPQSN